MENKIKLIVMDFDGTACHFFGGNYGSSWDAFSNVCGVYEKMNSLLRNYYAQPEKEEWMTREAVKLFKGKSIKLVDNLKPFPYSKGFVDFVNSRNGMPTGFLSSGLNVIVDEVVKELKLDFAISTELESENDILTGKVKRIIPLWKKEQILFELLDKYSVSPIQLCYIGDNENDIGCLRTARIGIAFNPKTKETREIANYVINDFRELNKILKN